MLICETQLPKMAQHPSGGAAITTASESEEINAGSHLIPESDIPKYASLLQVLIVTQTFCTCSDLSFCCL